jgi:hypothetical protein
MADLSQTASSVLPGADAVTERMTAGVAITAGQVVYLIDAAARTVGLADNNDASAVVRRVFGIALNGAAIGQPVVVQRSGEINVGATLTPGIIYVLSATAGRIAPAADLASGNFTTVLGIAKSASILGLDIHTANTAI